MPFTINPEELNKSAAKTVCNVVPCSAFASDASLIKLKDHWFFWPFLFGYSQDVIQSTGCHSINCRELTHFQGEMHPVQQDQNKKGGYNPGNWVSFKALQRIDTFSRCTVMHPVL